MTRRQAGTADVSTARRPRISWDIDDERLARVAWSRLAEPGDATAYQLVFDEGPVDALRKVLDRPAEAGRWRVRLPDVAPVRDLAVVSSLGGRVVIPGDEEWPRALDDLAHERPFCLWVRGPLTLSALPQASAAIVGCRASTSYGDFVAADLAAGCAERGIRVVSGAAYGIDGAAHRGALAADGQTVAVLACGVDRAYPRGHEALIGRLAQDGAVVSEVPPGSAPTRWRFLERNRLIAALTQVTVVVEAAHRSGALGTAGRALRIGRLVAAVPGPVTSAASAGCNQLVRDGAVCVTDAAEVAELLAPIGQQLVLPAEGRSADYDELSGVDLRVMDALPVGRGVAVGSLARVAGLSVAEILSGLGRLEVAGLATRDSAGWRRGWRS
jgi:DNA processing protein